MCPFYHIFLWFVNYITIQSRRYKILKFFVESLFMITKLSKFLLFRKLKSIYKRRNLFYEHVLWLDDTPTLSCRRGNTRRGRKQRKRKRSRYIDFSLGMFVYPSSGELTPNYVEPNKSLEF